MLNLLFVPLNGVAAQSITIAITTANVQLVGRSASAKSAFSLLNVGAAVSFFKFGNSNAVTASLTDQPIGPNERLIIPIPADFGSGLEQLWLAAIGSVGPVLYISQGVYI